MTARSFTRIIFPLVALIVFSGNTIKLIKPSATDGVVVSYLGNMGVLINTGNTSVLIDALHEFYGPEYLNTPSVEIKKIMNRQQPYSDTKLALFTHHHKDHFSSKLASNYLAVSTDNRIGGPGQVTESLSTDQVINSWNKNSQLFTADSLIFSVHAYNVPHTGRNRHSAVQNVSYLVKIDKLSILHIGDADTDLNVFKKLAVGKVDVMIVPVWFLMDEEGIQIIKDVIRPATVVATHISPKEEDSFNRYKLPGIQTHFFKVINQAIRFRRD